MANPAAAAFLHTSAVLLAPYPSLSAATAHRLASLVDGLAPATLATKCSCHAEIIGGLNGSVRLERRKGRGRGRLCLSCDGCGAVTRLDVVADEVKRFRKVKGRKPLGSPSPPIPTQLVRLAPAVPAKQPAQHPAPVRQLTAALASPMTVSPSPGPASPKPSVDATTKKRKRSKQTSGLAELLEEKRRKAGLAVQDGLKGFLEGI